MARLSVALDDSQALALRLQRHCLCGPGARSVQRLAFLRGTELSLTVQTATDRT